MESGRIFETDERKRMIAACIPRSRLYIGDFVVEIIMDRRNHPPLFLGVVQKLGSTEILFLGQFSSEPEAEAAAKQFIAEYLTSAEGEA